MKWGTNSGPIAAIIILTLVPFPAFAQRKVQEVEKPIAKIVNQPKSDAKEPIDTIGDYIEAQLDASLTFQIKTYSDPQSIRFKRKKAVVLRVIYQVNDEKKNAVTKDQLFLVQDGKVKQGVDFAAWLAQQQQLQQLQQQLVAQEVSIQQQQMAALAQPPQTSGASCGH
jgi:hypothetical protein